MFKKIFEKFLKLRVYMQIKQSGYFDNNYYLAMNSDVKAAGANPIWHYIIYGANEGRAPNVWFDVAKYSNITQKNTNPLNAYIRYRNNNTKSFKKSNNKKFDLDDEKYFIKYVSKKYNKNRAKVDHTLVSVIMPTFNRENTILAAIESVLKQTHTNLELIIIDDGSIDNTVSIIKQLSDSRIVFIESAHKGVSSARNLGLRKSQGQVISYLDSDNTWTENYLRYMVTCLVVEKMDCAYSAIKIINIDDKLLGYKGESFNWDKCIRSNYVDLNIFVHTRSLLDLGGFDEMLKRAVDWDLILRYTEFNKTYYAPFVGCHYLDAKKENNRITDDEPMIYGDIVYLKNKYKYTRNEIIQKIVLKIAIKVPVRADEASNCAYYNYAQILKDRFVSLGCTVRIDTIEDWYKFGQREDRVVINLNVGGEQYKVQKGQVNILWIVDHPELISYEQYHGYDICYVASLSYHSILRSIFNGSRIQFYSLIPSLSNFFEKKLDNFKQRILVITNISNHPSQVASWADSLGYELDSYNEDTGLYITDVFGFQETMQSSLLDIVERYNIVIYQPTRAVKIYNFQSFTILCLQSLKTTVLLDSVNYDEYIRIKDVLECGFVDNIGDLKEILEQQRNESSYPAMINFDAADSIKKDILNFINLKSPNQYKNTSSKINLRFLFKNNYVIDKSTFCTYITPITTSKNCTFFDIQFIGEYSGSLRQIEEIDILVVQLSYISDNLKDINTIISDKETYNYLVYLQIDIPITNIGVITALGQPFISIVDRVFSSYPNAAILTETSKYTYIEPVFDLRLFKNVDTRDNLAVKTKKLHEPVSLLCISDDINEKYTRLILILDALKQKFNFNLTFVSKNNNINLDQYKWIHTITLKNFSEVYQIERIVIKNITHAFVLEPYSNQSESKQFFSLEEYGTLGITPIVLDESVVTSDYLTTLLTSIESGKELDMVPTDSSTTNFYNILEQDCSKLYKLKNVNVKPICFYLPQFHPVDVNNENWGDGFTEWFNVAKAKPKFDNHIQPKIPTKFGFYDLRLVEIMKQQSDYAKEHGIFGFCFYYYRFGNVTELDLPVKNYAELDNVLPFCYCWANESWTRTWDGRSGETIRSQDYCMDTLLGLVDDLVDAFDKENYIKIDSKPVFIIYQVNKIPNYKNWIIQMKEMIYSKIKVDVIIGATYNSDITEEMIDTVDFIIQFPPHRIPRSSKRRLVDTIGRPSVYDQGNNDYFELYDHVAEDALENHDMFKKTVLGVCPDWDNSSRRDSQAHVLLGSTPDKFASWFSNAVEITKNKYVNQEIPDAFLFINAWNEWAEGAFLEPSLHYGEDYIKKIQEILLKKKS